MCIAIMHVPDLSRPFLTDDYLFLEQVRAGPVWETLFSPDPLGNFFRPVSRQLYFSILGTLSREDPWPLRLVNVVCFLVAVVLLFRIASRLLGDRGGLIAAIFYGLHYAAGVPLLWVSGCQDLLATTLALLSVDTALTGRRRISSIAFALALLSKETAIATPVAVAALFWARDGKFRSGLQKSASLWITAVLWAVVWVATIGLRPAGPTLERTWAASPVAALLHLVQVTLGLEARASGNPLGHWSGLALVAALGAAALIWLGGADSQRANDPRTSATARRRVAFAGVVWAVAASAPIALVISIWSAYFYLFALCGAAITVGALLCTRRRVVSAVIVAVLVMLSAQAGRLDEFSIQRDPWAWRSHLSQHYLRRAMSLSSEYLLALRSARPTLPHRSTVFFANVPVSAGWQAGNGALLRWAYRDSSLHSYFLGEFEKSLATRGPIYFFSIDDGTLVDHSEDPMMLPTIAFSMLVADQPARACGALDLILDRTPNDTDFRQWRAWARLATHDTLGAFEDLRAAGISPVFASALDSAAGQPGVVRDTAHRVEVLLAAREAAGLSPNVHARLAALYLPSSRFRQLGVVEAYAYRVLRPDAPDAWRKWASAQLGQQQYDAGLRSLERYLHLLAKEGRHDAEADQVAATLRRTLHGDVAQDALRPQHP
jgi:hypothetical protein